MSQYNGEKYYNIVTNQYANVLPTQIGSTWSPTNEQLQEAGWREIIDVEQPVEGTRVLESACSPIDGKYAQVVITQAISLAEEAAAAEAARVAAEQAFQNGKSLELKKAENRFLALCDQLTQSTSHAKLGFADLQNIILQIPDQAQQMYMAVQLLAIDAECKREGGNQWWNSVTWHEGINA